MKLNGSGKADRILKRWTESAFLTFAIIGCFVFAFEEIPFLNLKTAEKINQTFLNPVTETISAEFVTEHSTNKKTDKNETSKKTDRKITNKESESFTKNENSFSQQQESDNQAPIREEEKEETSNKAKSEAFNEYKQYILKKISSVKTYPAESRLKKEEGKVILHIVIDSTGKIESLEIQKKCDYDSLNSAALKAVKRAAPFKKAQALEHVDFTFVMDYSLSKTK